MTQSRSATHTQCPPTGVAGHPPAGCRLACLVTPLRGNRRSRWRQRANVSTPDRRLRHRHLAVSNRERDRPETFGTSDIMPAIDDVSADVVSRASWTGTGRVRGRVDMGDGCLADGEFPVGGVRSPDVGEPSVDSAAGAGRVLDGMDDLLAHDDDEVVVAPASANRSGGRGRRRRDRGASSDEPELSKRCGSSTPTARLSHQHQGLAGAVCRCSPPTSRPTCWTRSTSNRG